MSDRLNQVASHLNPVSATHYTGLMHDQVAIITGAGQGIGAAAARLFAAEGAKVVVSDIDDAKASAVAKEITDSGKVAIAISGDVMDPDFPKRLVDGTVQKFGGINVIVNNAGFTWDGVIHKMSDKQWDTMLACHGTGPFRIVRAAAPYLRKKDGAQKCIINISSTSGTHGNAGQINYSFAKAGVEGFTKTICKEWGMFGVRANTIAFGYIETRLTQDKAAGAVMMVDGKPIALGIPGRGKGSGSPAVSGVADIPLGRPGKAEEAAASILLLASPLASYVNGQTLEVTGGRGI